MKERIQGETGQSLLTSHRIIFVLSGIVKYSISDSPDSIIIVRSGEFVFFPISTNMIWEMLEDTTILLFNLNHTIGKLPECHTFRFQRFSVNQFRDRSIYPLKMNNRIHYFINGVEATERDGLKCNNYAKHLVAQLLTMIQVYYPLEEYMRFYSTIASQNVAFTDLVYEKWAECRSVGELANALNMPVPTFTLHFIKVFGEPPGTWLKIRRKEHIYHDICSSYKTLPQIAEEQNFAMPNFIRYCRKNFNMSPSVIRKNLIIKETDSK